MPLPMLAPKRHFNVYRESKKGGLKFEHSIWNVCLYTHSTPWNGHKGVPEEGITSSLSRQLADEQLAAYSQPSSWGLSQYKVLLLKGCIRHRCVIFSTQIHSLSLEVLVTHYVPGKVLSTGGTGANQRIRQTCSRSCFLKGCIGGNQAKG